MLAHGFLSFLCLNGDIDGLFIPQGGGDSELFILNMMFGFIGRGGGAREFSEN